MIRISKFVPFLLMAFLAMAAPAFPQGSSISALPAATPAPGDLVPIVHSGVTSKTTVRELTSDAAYNTFHTSDYGGCNVGDDTSGFNATYTAAALQQSLLLGGATVVIDTFCLAGATAPTISGPLQIIGNNTHVTSTGGDIQVAAGYTAGDVLQTSPSNYTFANINIDHINLRYLGSQTSGASFDLPNCNGCSVSYITWNGTGHAYDLVYLGGSVVANAATGIHLSHFTNAASSYNGAALRLGCGTVGTVFLSDGVTNGSGTTGTSEAIVDNDSSCASAPFHDLIYVENWDFEGIGTGIDIAYTKGVTTDWTFANVYVDGPQTGPAFSASGTNPGTVSRIKLSNVVLDAGPTQPGLKLRSPGLAGYVADFVMIGGWLGAGSTASGGDVGVGVTGVLFNGIQAYESGFPVNGLLLNGTHITVTGSHIGNVYNAFGNGVGIAVGATGSYINIFNNDLEGNTTKAITTASGAGPVNILGNSVLGYSGAPFTINAASVNVIIANNPGYTPTACGITGTLAAWATQAGLQAGIDTSGNAAFCAGLTIGGLLTAATFQNIVLNNAAPATAATNTVVLTTDTVGGFVARSAGTTARFQNAAGTQTWLAATNANAAFSGQVTATTGVVGTNMVANAAASNFGAGTIAYGSTFSGTVGSAGGASALPSAPANYLIINSGGTNYKIPVYNP